MAVTTLPSLSSTYLLSAADQTTGLGKHPLFRRAPRMETFTILITGSDVQALQEPEAGLIKAADSYYLGGSDYTVSGAIAQQIFNAGYGRWLTEVA